MNDAQTHGGQRDHRDGIAQSSNRLCVFLFLSILHRGEIQFTPCIYPKRTSKINRKKKDTRLIQEFDGRGISPCQICIAFGRKPLFFYTYIPLRCGFTMLQMRKLFYICFSALDCDCYQRLSIYFSVHFVKLFRGSRRTGTGFSRS